MALIKITAHPSDGSTALMFSADLTKEQLQRLNALACDLADENEKPGTNGHHVDCDDTSEAAPTVFCSQLCTL
jgi:hypothetical protein